MGGIALKTCVPRNEEIAGFSDLNISPEAWS
jgi:hypothetical protein